ncbi:hypothetical protein DSECCO2_545970 [anaerobic digester metagenome]
MKKIPLVVWGILICLVFVHYFYTPEQPENATGEMKIDLDPGERQPDLVNLWDALVRGQAFSNESAVLIQLNQFIDKDGEVQYTQVGYTGDVNGEQHAYEVYVYPDGNVHYKDQKYELPLQGVHPLAILREVTLINYANLTHGEYNITLKTFRNEGEMTYNKTHGDLCVLSNGSFHSLREAVFSHGTCWYAIMIVPEVVGPGGNRTIGGLPDRLIIFTEQDIALADAIIYT